jgi:bacillopeptidase F
MRRPVLVALLAGAALATAAGALADFTTDLSASQTLATATLAPPTGTAAAQVSCKNNKPPQINVTWTPSASSFTSGYTIYRSTTDGSGYTQIGTTGSSGTSFTDPSTTLAYNTTYYYVVDAAAQSWSARSAQAQVTTLGSKCT